MSAGALLYRGSSRAAVRLHGSSVLRRGGLNAVNPHRIDGVVFFGARYYASKEFPPHTVVTMPALSPTMTAGNIGTWQKKVGDNISPGDVLVEIETDKAQMDFEFQEEGTLAKILRDSGEKDVAVGNPIAIMVGEGEDVAAFEAFTIDDAGGNKDAPKEEKEPEIETKKETKEEPSEKPKSSDSKPQAPPKVETTEVPEGRLQPSLDRMSSASPRVKALALEKGVPLKDVKGSGPNGRVTVEDIEKYKPTSSSSSGGPPGQSASTPAIGPSYEDIPISGMRKTIASRLAQSMQTAPHYYVSATLSVSKLLKLRQSLNSSANGKYKISVNDFLIKAIAVACKKVPAANASWLEKEGVVRQFKNVDVSVAVSTKTGLMTPIVKNADLIGLELISSTVKELGKKARDGKLKPEEYQGGTVTISNMGMNPAVERFTAVINPPQSCILAVGTTQKVAVPVEGEDGLGVGWEDQIVVTASFDHRTVDGAVGAEWIAALKKVVESPLELLL